MRRIGELAIVLVALVAARAGAAPWSMRTPTTATSTSAQVLARPGERVLLLLRECPSPCGVKLVEVDREALVVRDLRLDGPTSVSDLQDTATLPGGDIVLAVDAVRTPGTQDGVVYRLDRKLAVASGIRLTDFFPRSVHPLPDGALLLAGVHGPATPRSAAVLRLEADGTVGWAVAIRNRTNTFAQHVLGMPDGGCIVLVTFPGGGTDDGLVVKLARDGSLQWQRRFASANYDTVLGVSLAPDGAAELAIFTNPETGLIAFDQDGAIVRSRAIRWPSFVSTVRTISHDPQGRLVLTGSYSSGGERGLAVTVLEPDDTPAWSEAQDLSTGSLGVGHPPVFTESGAMWMTAEGSDAAGGSSAALLRLTGSGPIDPFCAHAVLAPLFEPAAGPSTGTESFDPITVATSPEAATLSLGLTDLLEQCRGTEGEPPSEVSPSFSPEPLRFTDRTTLSWEQRRHSASESFDVYRGLVDELPLRQGPTCRWARVASPTCPDPDLPGIGRCFYYLVSGRNVVGRGPLGYDTFGGETMPRTACP